MFSGFGRTAVRSRYGPLMVIRNELYPNGPLRVAFSVPRRVGPAVVRNRLRRQLRAIIDGMVKADSFPGGTYMIVVRPEARGSRFDDLKTWLNRAIERMPAA